MRPDTDQILFSIIESLGAAIDHAQGDGYKGIVTVMERDVKNAEVLREYIASIENELKQAQEVRDKAIEFALHSGYCEKHSGENTPPFEVFIERIKDKCFLCVLDENDKLTADLSAIRTIISEVLGIDGEAVWLSECVSKMVPLLLDPNCPPIDGTHSKWCWKDRNCMQCRIEYYLDKVKGTTDV